MPLEPNLPKSRLPHKTAPTLTHVHNQPHTRAHQHAARVPVCTYAAAAGSQVGQTKGHTLANKEAIWDVLKPTGITDAIIAVFKKRKQVQ
jgi:hypothetical protein